MTIAQVLESKGTLLDLFEKEAARKIFEEEMAKRVTKAVGLRVTLKPGANVKPVVIQLTLPYLKQTPDNHTTREALISRATKEEQALIIQLGIRKLSEEGVKFESGYDVTTVA